MGDFTLFLPLTKADEEKRLVWGRAAVEEPDKSKEIMDYASAKPQFQVWSDGYSKATMGKSFGNIRAMHNPKHLAGKVTEIVYNDQAKAVDICVKVLDPVDWAKVEEGGYTGFSIGGGYLKKWADQASGCTRYTPRIQEISFVDSPCIPSARIMEMQKQDGSTEEVLLKGVPRSFAELLPPPSFGDLAKVSLGGIASRVGRGIKAAEHAVTRPAYNIARRRAEADFSHYSRTWPASIRGVHGTAAEAQGHRVAERLKGAPLSSEEARVARHAGRRMLTNEIGHTAGEEAQHQAKTGLRTIGTLAGVGVGGNLAARALGFSHKKNAEKKTKKLGKIAAPWKHIALGAAGGISGTALGSELYPTGNPTGKAVGGETGATLGEVIGSRFGGLKGAVIGGVAGGLGGALLGGKVGNKHPHPPKNVATPRKPRRAGRPTLKTAPDGDMSKARGFRGLNTGRRVPGLHHGSRNGVLKMGKPPATPGTAIMRRAARPSAPSAPSAPSGGTSGFVGKRAPMQKIIGEAAARAGVAMLRHAAYHTIPTYAGLVGGSAAAKAGYAGVRQLGAKLRIGGKLSPRQKRILLGAAAGAAGGATGIATHRALQHGAKAIDKEITERHGRPRAPGERKPWETHKSAEMRLGLQKQGYEGSAKDLAEDRRGARRKGLSLKAYERTAQDRREDVAGEKRMTKSLGGMAMRGVMRAVESPTGRKTIKAVGRFGAKAKAVGRSMQEEKTHGLAHAVDDLGRRAKGAMLRGGMSAVNSPVGQATIRGVGRVARTAAAHPHATAGVMGGSAALGGYALGRSHAKKQEPAGELNKLLPLVMGVGGALLGAKYGGRIGARVGAKHLGNLIYSGKDITPGALGRTIGAHWGGKAAGLAGGAVGGTAAGRALEGRKEKKLKKNLAVAGAIARGVGSAAVSGARGVAQGVKAFAKNPRSTTRKAIASAAKYTMDNPEKVVMRSLPIQAGLAVGLGAKAISSRNADPNAKKQELIGRLQKNILLQDDNTVSQWRQARSNEYGPRPFWQMPKDVNDPKQTTMAGMPEQKYGKSPGLLGSIFGKADVGIEMLKQTSPAEREKIRQTLHEFKQGKLKSFRADRPKRKMPKVTDRKQAIAIALSQARRMGKGDDGLVVAALADRLLKARSTARAGRFQHEDSGAYLRARRNSGESMTDHAVDFAVGRGSSLAGLHGGVANMAREHVGDLSGVPGATTLSHLVGGGLASSAGGVVGAGARSVLGSLREAKHAAATRNAISGLSAKEHAQRIAAARSRWKKEMSHVDMDSHHKQLEEYAGRSLFGSKAKLAYAKEQAQHFWHHVARAHEAHDKMRAHVDPGAAIIMQIPHRPHGFAGNLLHNPNGIGAEHFDRRGKPKQRIYLMHPDDVDDWVKKHGKKLAA